MKTELIISFFFARLLVAPLVGAEKCPNCGVEVVTVGTVSDDETKPSKNQWVWDRSSCANLLHDKDSLICTRCWLVKDRTEPTVWMRSSELPSVFVIPLSAAIRGFPAPKNSANYDQRFEAKNRVESLSFWCEDSKELIAGFQRYCEEHGLTIKVERSERHPREAYVLVEQKPIAQQAGTGQPATAPELKSEGKDKPQPESIVAPR